MKALPLLLSNLPWMSCQFYESLHEEKPAILIDFDHLELEGGGAVYRGLQPVGTLDGPDFPEPGPRKGRRDVEDQADRYIDPEHWSTCEDFKDIGGFNVRYVLNNTWIPFYLWSTIASSFTYLNFTLPTQQDVSDFRTPYETMGLKLNWDGPKLLMIDWATRYLLVSGDRHGLFHLMAELTPEVTQVLKSGPNQLFAPDVMIRIKVLHPHLLIINCFAKMTVLLAPMGQVPTGRAQKTAVAKGTGYKGSGTPLRRQAYAYVSEKHLRETKSDYIRHMQRELDKLAMA